MTSKTLKIALALSVALNLFAAAAATTLVISRDRAEDQVAAQRNSPRAGPLADVIAGMDPAVAERVRSTMRASALAARPDFEEARQTRRQAVELSRDSAFNPEQVLALLDRSRQAEARGRARLEAEAVTLLGTLDRDDREAMSRILMKRSGRGGRDRAREMRPVS